VKIQWQSTIFNRQQLEQQGEVDGMLPKIEILLASK